MSKCIKRIASFLEKHVSVFVCMCVCACVTSTWTKPIRPLQSFMTSCYCDIHPLPGSNGLCSAKCQGGSEIKGASTRVCLCVRFMAMFFDVLAFKRNNLQHLCAYASPIRATCSCICADGVLHSTVLPEKPWRAEGREKAIDSSQQKGPSGDRRQSDGQWVNQQWAHTGMYVTELPCEIRLSLFLGCRVHSAHRKTGHDPSTKATQCNRRRH